MKIYKSMEDKLNHILQYHKSNVSSKLPKNAPMISIIILNYNGHEHLKRLFKTWKESTIYDNYEIIIIDNNSNDESVLFLEKISKYLPIRIIKNSMNINFSQGCNQGAKLSKGEYLLLLNNDTEVTYGWLNEMVRCAFMEPNVGAIGAKLLYPMTPVSKHNILKALRVQHSGIDFKVSNGMFMPYNMGNGCSPFDKSVNNLKYVKAVTGAALLVKKENYYTVLGLDEEFDYGFEDVDFCLKLLKNGLINIYCPTSLILHHENGTQSIRNWNDTYKRWKRNSRYFINKWNDWLLERYS